MPVSANPPGYRSGPLNRYGENYFSMEREPITIIGETDFRNYRKRFGIRRRDRRAHTYLIGKTGTGKSTLIANLVLQDIARGEGLALLDPHGDLVDQVLQNMPVERKADLIHFNVPDATAPLAFNPLEALDPASRPLVASGLISVFQKLWPESWGPRMEYILRNALLTVVELPDSTLLDIPRILVDADFRHWAVGMIRNLEVRKFWLREFEKYPANFRTEAIAPIQNKVGQFVTSPLLRNIIGQPKSAFDLRRIMDDGKILLVNLAKGKIGEDTAALLGSMLVTKMGLAALSRANIEERKRRDFYLYVDEFPTFTTTSFASMLAEMRKYRLNMILAQQHLSQIDEQVRDAIFGNVGTLIAFRVGASDAELLEKEFQFEFTADDLVNLPNYHIYLRLMIDGVMSRPFSALTVRS